MLKNLFISDKNYLLQEVQIQSRDKLIQEFILKAIREYQIKNNPLGIEDNMVESLKNYEVGNKNDFYYFYNKIAGIYRYRSGENQLSFIWDGRNHKEFYKENWTNFFKSEIKSMLKKSSFIKIILNLTALKGTSESLKKLHYKLSDLVRKKFHIQVFKRKGIVLRTI